LGVNPENSTITAEPTEKIPQYGGCCWDLRAIPAEQLETLQQYFAQRIHAPTGGFPVVGPDSKEQS
jgi:hypothetical protein